MNYELLNYSTALSELVNLLATEDRALSFVLIHHSAFIIHNFCNP
jgi:hypothetical protein